MNKITVIGLIAIILGTAMLIFAGGMFAYRGPALNPIVNNLGKYSFFLWLPTIVVGIAFLTWPKAKKN